MVHLLRIDPVLRPPTKNITIFYKRLLATCSSLVSTFSNPEESKVTKRPPRVFLRLAHLSVKEYLVSEELKQSSVGGFWMSHGLGNRVMAEHCVSCLLQHDDVISFGSPALDMFPLTKYASRNFLLHAKEANEETERGLLDHLLFDFSCTPDVYVNWERVNGRDITLELPTQGEFPLPRVDYRPAAVSAVPSPSPTIRLELRTVLAALVIRIQHASLVFATKYNVWRLVTAMLQEAQPGNKTMDKAMTEGLDHQAYDSLKALVTIGKADINSRYGGWGPTLLERCITTDGIRWLLANGASVHPDPDRFRHPLHSFCDLAFYERHFHQRRDSSILAKYLLELGEDPDTAFEYPYNHRVWLSTPLQVAAFRENMQFLELLLDHGATLNLVQGRAGSSLHAAALGASTAAFSFLLSRGADIHPVSEQYGTMIWSAGYGGSGAIIQTCLERGLSWDEFIDTELESARGREWGTLDGKTQSQLIARIIRVSRERQCKTLGEALVLNLLTFKEAEQTCANAWCHG